LGRSPRDYKARHSPNPKLYGRFGLKQGTSQTERMAAGFGNYPADKFDVHRQASGLAAVQLQ
jgi:hypothetical protein